MGKKGAERDRELIIFDKLLLLLKKKDSNRYNYKGHIEVSLSVATHHKFASERIVFLGGDVVKFLGCIFLCLRFPTNFSVSLGVQDVFTLSQK